MGIAPAVELRGTAFVFGGDVQPAHVSYFFVDDDQLAVVAVVRLQLDLEHVGGEEEGYLAAGCLQTLQMFFLDLPRAHGIQKQAYFHAFLGFFAKHAKDAETHVVGLHDEVLHVDELLSRLQIPDQLVKLRPALRKDAHVVVLGVEGHGVDLIQVDQILPFFALRVHVAVPAVGHVVHLDAQILSGFLHFEARPFEQLLPRDVLGEEKIKKNAQAREQIDDHEPRQRGGRALSLQEDDGEAQKKIDDEDRRDDRRRGIFIERDQSVQGSEHFRNTFLCCGRAAAKRSYSSSLRAALKVVSSTAPSMRFTILPFLKNIKQGMPMTLFWMASFL